jgi:hypothetical protein
MFLSAAPAQNMQVTSVWVMDMGGRLVAGCSLSIVFVLGWRPNVVRQPDNRGVYGALT